jgi:uncharacterized membrane protein YfcA
MTPVLVLMFGIAPATAVGTDLLYASLTKMGGSWVHGRRGTVDWKVVKLLAMGSLPAALLSMALLHYLALDEKHLKSLITSVLSVALLLTAAALLFKPYLIKLGRRPDGVMFELHAHHLTGATIFTGAILGVLVTISSVGAGALGVVVLLFLYPRAPMAKIVGTDIAHAVPLTLIAGLGHAALGTVNYGLLGSLLLGSLPGIYLGSHLGIKIPDHVLRPILATMLTTIGIKLMLY